VHTWVGETSLSSFREKKEESVPYTTNNIDNMIEIAQGKKKTQTFDT